MVYGLRLARPELQAELVREARARGAGCYVDPEGFLVVHSEDDCKCINRHLDEIRLRVLQRDWWSCGSGHPAFRDAKRREAEGRGVPFLEYDTLSDGPNPYSARQQAPWKSHHLDIRRESSLPKGRRPWDRARG